ncbi:hypothetical protein HWC54_gp153 [Klebsiella phage Marfa]|uniref:Uncharacterized protein n=1 Tax=Klebsiella phage Marfa TaxID=2587809 RepID=A0A4Y5TSD9_9CAUD|nr:hypothetical protein HWC54_gp153 [Klebsiella phage Marfa]QDB71919.1 hypothetical protein CPT_Marfa_274 [Klebsiella phage Marfa]
METSQIIFLVFWLAIMVPCFLALCKTVFGK